MNYLKEWQKIGQFNKRFFNRIAIILATINCEKIKSESVLCGNTKQKEFKYILLGKYFGEKIYSETFDIFYAINNPLKFLMRSIENHLYRLDDWTAITERKLVVKDMIIIVNIRVKEETDMLALLELFKLEEFIGSRFVANMSHSHQNRKITILNGNCVANNTNKPNNCIKRKKYFLLNESFVCESFLSILDIETTDNIMDISNQMIITNKYLLQLTDACDSVFMAHIISAGGVNVIKSFKKYSQIFPSKSTILILLSRKQIKSVFYGESNLIHFNKKYLKNPIRFDGSFTDERLIENFFLTQFHILTNHSTIRPMDIYIYNEDDSDDIIMKWNDRDLDSNLYFIPPLDVKSNRNVHDYLMENIKKQNFTILVLVQKWIVEFEILSNALNQANKVLAKDLGIEHIYQGIDCWKFDKFCLKSGIDSIYPGFFIYKNGGFIKSLKTGEYSIEKFIQVGYLFYQEKVFSAISFEDFHNIVSRLSNISDIFIVIVRGTANSNKNLLEKIAEIYHGVIPIISTILSFLPLHLQNQVNDVQEPNLITAHKASDGWRYLKPKVLMNLNDAEISINLAKVYLVNSLNLQEINQFKSEKRQILLHINIHVDVPRLQKLREDLYDNIILKYVNASSNTELLRLFEITTTPVLIYLDFLNNVLYKKYDGIWGSLYILDWIASILRGEISPIPLSKFSKQATVKPRIYYENKIYFGSVEIDQSQYYVSNQEILNEYTTKNENEFENNTTHDEL